ncbi:hypothetical protein IE53DRAFT_389348 [Violaceomyces palustris]|uniref:Uncharacterized protein n=1 Tax=Violaceomyces palustris TaxID=1673888 RepID=A0ACD0NRN2_9BASI|nr:hypothetical protein IE53DRAFT_389348 [Violaceomyces palustris]
MSSLSPSPRPRVPPPKVLPSYTVRSILSVVFSPFFFSFLKKLLTEPITINPPTWLRLLLGLFIVLNYRSLPFMWHWRVLVPAIKARSRSRPSIHPLLPFIGSKRHTTTRKGIEPRLRLDAVPVGRDVFTDASTYRLRATLDECDWNGHLSNSSYPKNLDSTRMAHVSERFLRMHFDGAWVALGGSAFTFHREIPVLAKYDIRMSIDAWDEKWIYVVGKFVSPSKSSSSSSQAAAAADSGNGKGKARQSQSLVTSLWKGLNGLLAAPPSHASKVVRSSESEQKEGETIKNVGGGGKAKDRKAFNEAKGETVYCTSVSRYCFKAGRRTIPPWLVIATSGYGTWASTQTNWDKAETLRAKFLSESRSEYRRKTGKELPRDSYLLGSGFRKAGLLSAYRLESERKGTEDEAWMSEGFWELKEWEERRVEGLERLSRVVGGVVATSNTKVVS